MLNIVFAGGRVAEWRVGKPVPSLAGPKVQVLRASGDELHYIRRYFTGMPIANTPGHVHVIWVGEMAAFIAHNL